MRRLFVFLVAFALLFAYTGAVLAQDATPEPTPTEPPVVVVSPSGWQPEDFILAAVAFGLLAAFVLVLRPTIVQLGHSAPSWAVDAAFASIDKILQTWAERALTTPSTLDDSLVADWRKELDGLREEIARLRGDKSVANAGPLPPWSGPGRTPGS